jgi:cation transport regulator ChaC
VYTIEGVNNIRTVLDYLNVREQGGYTQMNLPVYTDESCTEVLVEEAIVFQATPENPEFLGLEPVPVMAATIADSVGPSGPNTEYLLELDDALRAAGRRDDHVAELADAVRALLAQRATSAS